MYDAFKDYIAELVNAERIFYKEPMSKRTTFQVGGEADCLIEIASEKELPKILDYLMKVEIPYFIMGNGSNLLVSDKGYEGVVLNVGSKMREVQVQGQTITAQAGVLLSTLSKVAYENELSGLEFASGIPGSLGGAIVMNAGAYDSEMKMVVESVNVMNREGEILTLSGEAMEFGYRTSIVKNRPFIVLDATIKLIHGEKEVIKEKMDEFAQKRHQKQPLEYPSAGSTFKRPEGYFAGKLIMDAGLRGYRVGNAQVSEKHCGFVINLGEAQASDVYELIQEVQEKVKDQFGVSLEPELVMLGEF